MNLIHMKMRWLICVVFSLLFISENALADYAANLEILRIRSHAGHTLFGTTPKPGNTCSNWGEYFIFDNSTDEGKAYLSMLLSAKAQNKKIEIWYTPSAANGSDQTSGCNNTTTSTLTGVGLR